MTVAKRERRRAVQKQIQSQREAFDEQRDELDRERRKLAAQQGRDPIITQAIGGISVTLTCRRMLPMA